jgi:SAM-dependent methyltransferase
MARGDARPQPDRYRTSWEGFWATLTGEPGEVFWDSDPALASREDLLRFRNHVDPQLPLIDLGCGNGTQTCFLAEHFATVIGTEISRSALDLARANTTSPAVSYRILDALRPEDAAALHREIGDANVYVRTVLHQFSPVDQVRAIESIERLLGERGTLYFVELSSAANPYYDRLIKEYGMPPGLARIFEYQITPGLMDEADLETLFPLDRFKILDTGASVVRTTHTLPTGERVDVPAFYAVIRRVSPTEKA